MTRRILQHCPLVMLLLISSVPTSAEAQHTKPTTIHITSNSDTCMSAARLLQEAINSLPKQGDWDWWVVCGEKRWAEIRQHYGNPNTRAVFTYSDWKQNFNSFSFINADAIWPDAFDLRNGRTLRATVAHEMGHVVCRCTDEQGADKAADALLKQ
jgi:hypothetical protein